MFTFEFVGYAIAIWLLTLGILFLLGTLLSRMVLRNTNQFNLASDEINFGRRERILLGIYHGMIIITSIYFYLSIPFLLLTVIATGWGIISLSFYLGLDFLGALLGGFFVSLSTLITLYSIFFIQFSRSKDVYFGYQLHKEAAPQLWSLIEEVANRVGTRPIDVIYVTPWPEIIVIEQGTILKKLQGRGQRCLILGLGILLNFPQSQFKTILAHGYGSFINRDILAGAFALHSQATLYRMIKKIEIFGLARWFNPAWLFIVGYHRFFLRITRGASRLQSVLADRYAARAYNANDLIDGLLHILRQKLLFSMNVPKEITRARQQGQKPQNVYKVISVRDQTQKEQLESEIAKILESPASPYSSEPSLRDRISFLEKFKHGRFADVNPALASDLLPNLEELQTKMIATIETKYS